MLLVKNTWCGNGLQDEDDRKYYRNFDMHDREKGIEGYIMFASTSASP